MTNELSNHDQSEIVHALAMRADDCARRVDDVSQVPYVGHEDEQVTSLSYWIRSGLQAQRTLVRAREVFWS